MIWGFCVYFVYMIPLETDVLRKHRFQKLDTNLIITIIQGPVEFGKISFQPSKLGILMQSKKTGLPF